MHSGIGPLDRGKEKQGSGTKNRDEREFIAKLSGECQSSSSRSQEDLTALVATDSQSMPKGWPPSGKKDFFAIAPTIQPPLLADGLVLALRPPFTEQQIVYSQIISCSDTTKIVKQRIYRH